MSAGAHADQELIDRWQTFISNYIDNRGDDVTENQLTDLIEGYPTEQKSLYVDWSDLYTFDRDMAEDILTQPEDMLEYASEAVREYDIPVDVTLSNVNIRIENLAAIPDSYRCTVAKLRSDHRNQLVAITGQVAKRSKGGRGQYTEAAFECQRCGTFTRIPQTRGRGSGGLQEPHECQGCERQGPFIVNDDQSEARDYQLVRLQQPPEQSKGATAAEVDVIFADDLVDEVKPGERVTVLAEMWSVPEENSNEATFVLRGEANNVRHHETDYEDIDITAEDKDRIKEIAANDPFDQLTASIKPSHYGDENIKQAIALQLFGGTWKEAGDGDIDRGTIHVLLVGDPGTDKSGLLHYAAQLSPRSVKTSGKNATQAGLTCAAVHDDFGDTGWSLEGGAIVEADGGLCAIDEFDKIPDEVIEGVHGAMADGEISPSKAGINTTIPARATVLAAANPKYGRFDQFEPIGEQIELSPTMFSRFDLIFTVTDQPDPDADAALAEHKLDTTQAAQQRERGATPDQRKDADPEIDEDLLRKYVAYAREELDPPVMTEAAKQVINDFYTDLREHGIDDDSPVPVTARKIDALVRLSEASARIRLSDTVDEEDAHRATSIVLDCLTDVGVDPESGEFDADVVETGTSKSQRERMETVQEVIDNLEGEYDDGAPYDEVLERMDDRGFRKSRVKKAIEADSGLKQKGEVYEPRDGYLRLT